MSDRPETWCPRCGFAPHDGACTERCPLGHAEHIAMPCVAYQFTAGREHGSTTLGLALAIMLAMLSGMYVAHQLVAIGGALR